MNLKSLSDNCKTLRSSSKIYRIHKIHSIQSKQDHNQGHKKQEDKTIKIKCLISHNNEIKSEHCSRKITKKLKI